MRTRCVSVHCNTHQEPFKLGHSTIRSIVGVCQRTIDNYIDDDLPYTQLCKIRYINREDLDAWVGRSTGAACCIRR